MARFAQRFRVIPDEHGLMLIEERGRCLPSDVNRIRQGCTWRYKIEVFPNAAGGILKALDGTRPVLETVTVSTTRARYRAVKVAAYVNPFAPAQTGGSFSGRAILEYMIRYHEAGGVA